MEQINWAAVAAISSLVGVLVTITVGAFQSGRLSQKVSDHDDRFTEQSKTNLYVNEKISEHDRALSRIDGHLNYPNS